MLFDCLTKNSGYVQFIKCKRNFRQNKINFKWILGTLVRIINLAFVSIVSKKKKMNLWQITPKSR